MFFDPKKPKRDNGGDEEDPEIMDLGDRYLCEGAEEGEEK